MSFHYEKIDHVQLAAPKNEEHTARDFYQRILKFQEIDKPITLKKNGGVWFQAGSVKLHIGVEAPFFPAKKAHPAILVNQLKQLREHLINQKVDVIDDDRLPGANRFYIHDPFGNRLEFLEWTE
ncbi:glyoxalase [Cerasibacillus sp. JNUCC 74]|jgi:catechol 2,3-dioxygenase-like lactoylglutathione lyase family enzyme|uniref:glyoxalase n=1 Tax=Virgibacillus proomii TaxID=84407 RepID=UPI0009871A2B|nr:glyoxalase [Virgibacillus proomii]